MMAMFNNRFKKFLEISQLALKAGRSWAHHITGYVH